MSKDTDNARIAELNSKVATLGAKVSPNALGTVGLNQDNVDRGLGTLAANNEILGVKGTRSTP
jgi:hypothetical protein